MADLIALYGSHGPEVTAGELPDFLPLFLEFLSLVPDATRVRCWLSLPSILRALADRLARGQRLCRGVRDVWPRLPMRRLPRLRDFPTTTPTISPHSTPHGRSGGWLRT